MADCKCQMCPKDSTMTIEFEKKFNFNGNDTDIIKTCYACYGELQYLMKFKNPAMYPPIVRIDYDDETIKICSICNRLNKDYDWFVCGECCECYCLVCDKRLNVTTKGTCYKC